MDFAEWFNSNFKLLQEVYHNGYGKLKMRAGITSGFMHILLDCMRNGEKSVYYVDINKTYLDETEFKTLVWRLHSLDKIMNAKAGRLGGREYWDEDEPLFNHNEPLYKTYIENKDTILSCLREDWR